MLLWPDRDDNYDNTITNGYANIAEYLYTIDSMLSNYYDHDVSAMQYAIANKCGKRFEL